MDAALTISLHGVLPVQLSPNPMFEQLSILKRCKSA
jgi:hypothetical protein